jgi:hypothetical protein
MLEFNWNLNWNFRGVRFYLNIIYIVGRIAAAIAGDIILLSLVGLLGDYTGAYTMIFRGIFSIRILYY